MTEEKLKEIDLRDENPDTPGSLCRRARKELELRDKKREQKEERERQKVFLETLQHGLNRIVDLLERANKKPLLYAILGVLGLIAIGTLGDFFGQVLFHFIFKGGE